MKYILKLDSYIVLFRPFSITDIANYLPIKYNVLYISKNQIKFFIKHYLKL